MRHTNVKYGRRASGKFSVHYVVYVSRSRIGLGVIYVHVKSIGFLRVNLEHAHWHAPFGKGVIYVGSQYIYIIHAHIFHI